LGGPVQPAEFAPLFVFLVSEEPSYITSEVVDVTGAKLEVLL
jgi:NAD(P)-dependent dehydrogenase (short-subunit alcohol dehydrogenase family)